MLNRLPELYAGIQREAINFPVQYLGANVPQAWAAGSIFFFLQSVLGLQPDAPNGMLYVDPVLPVWLPDIHLRGLRTGKQSFDIRFWRSGEETRFAVTKGSSDCVARQDMKLWGETAAERATALPPQR